MAGYWQIRRGCRSRCEADRRLRFAGSPLLALDELDLVAVRVFDEGDHRGAVLHRPGLAGDLAAAPLDLGAGLVGVVHLQRDVTVGRAKLVLVDAPVAGELELGAADLLAVDPLVVAEEGEGELAVGVVPPRQQLHPQDLGIEGDGAVEIADPQHGMEDAHGISYSAPRDRKVPADVMKPGYSAASIAFET